MFSSIAPFLSNSASIKSNSAKSVAALTPVTPDDWWPLEVIALNNPSVPTISSSSVFKLETVESTVVELDPLADSIHTISR